MMVGAGHQTCILPTGVGCHGPMNQNKFLHMMGIRRRLEVCFPSLATPTNHAYN